MSILGKKIVERITGSVEVVKKTLLLTGVGFAGTLLLAGCSDTTQQATGTEAVRSGKADTAVVAAAPPAAEEDKLIIGLYDDYPPLTLRNPDGELQGFDIDLAREVMDRIGEKYEFKSIDWGSKEGLLNNSRRIDMLWSGVHISEERKKIFDFTNAYMENPTVIAVRSDSDIQTIDEIGGKVVGIQEGFFAIPFAKRWSGSQGGIARLVEEPENSLLLGDLMGGKVDAVVIDRTQILYFAGNTPGKFRIIPGEFVESDIAVALRKNDGELLNRINGALTEVRNDGTYQRIYEKWFGAE